MAPALPAAPAPFAAVHYEPIPQVWAPVDEPWLDRITRTDLRLALAFFLSGLVAVFFHQVPLGGQVVVGAPLFEEFFKLGLALLPWAALRIQSLAVRLPTAGLVGVGFGVMEHFLSYGDEPTFILYGRMAFHGLTCALSMAVLHGLRGADRRLLLAATLPSSFIHAGNNSAAVSLGLFGLFSGLDEHLLETLGLRVAAVFLFLLVVACATWPIWMQAYRSLLERRLLPRLRPDR